MSMKWVSAVSDKPSLAEAIQEAAADLRSGLGDATPDLLLAFVSHHHAEDYADVPGHVAALRPRVFLGCSAGGVIGAGHEVEHRPGVSLTAAVLPGVDLRPFHLGPDEMPGLDESPRTWHETLKVPPTENLHFIVLPEPFSCDAESLLLGLDYAYPRSVTIGGVASGGSSPGSNALFLDSSVHPQGMVGLALRGNIRVETIVAQGCRPIGEPRTITRCDRNFLLELDGRPPLEILREVFRTLSPRDRELFNSSLFLGVAMDESRDEYRQGDFLIRNIIGADQESGAIAVGARLEDRRVVQFQLRDAVTSAEDLQALLDQYVAESPEPAEGALLFSCLGRGSYLYGRSDHDTGMFREIVGPVSVGGFFCNGEIGPVAGTTFIHGYTSAFGIFRPLKES